MSNDNTSNTNINHTPDQDEKAKPAVILPPTDAPEPVADPQAPDTLPEKKNPPAETEIPTDHARNPNPRANENLPDEPGDEKKKTDGVGSEITDGEAG